MNVKIIKFRINLSQKYFFLWRYFTLKWNDPNLGNKLRIIPRTTLELMEIVKILEIDHR